MWWKNMLACGIFQGRKKNIACKGIKQEAVHAKEENIRMHACWRDFFFLVSPTCEGLSPCK
jgi:hypothetical protein